MRQTLSQSTPFSVKQTIISKLARTDELTGLVILSQSGTVFIQNSQGFQNLNLTQHITSIGHIRFYKDVDSIILCSANTLSVYDVERNQTIFTKELSEGISTFCTGLINFNGQESNPIILIGSNCLIEGYDSDGNQSYWNITGDEVNHIIILDQKYIIVSTKDLFLRVYEIDAIVQQIQQHHQVTHLIPIDESRYVYALDSGTIHLAHLQKRTTKIKHKIQVSSISYDNNYLIIARKDQSVEIRELNKGDLLFKTQLQISIIQVICGTLEKKEQIIFTEQDGLKGFVLGDLNEANNQQQEIGSLDELVQRRNELQQRLNENKTGGSVIVKGAISAQVGVIHDWNKGQLFLSISTTKQNTIRNVIIQSAQQLEVANFSEMTNLINISLISNNYVQLQLTVHTMISQHINSTQMVVHEQIVNLPKFAVFALCDQTHLKFYIQPRQILTLQLNERLPRYLKWLQQCFIIDQTFINSQQSETLLEVKFIHIIDKIGLELQQKADGSFTIKCDSIEVVAAIVQDLAEFINLQNLSSQGDFPLAIQRCKELIEVIQDLRQNKQNISADVMESINNIKEWVVRAEDQKQNFNYPTMNLMYSDIIIENKKMMISLQQKEQQSNLLMNKLKELNTLISQACGVRVGKYRTEMSQKCREFIKDSNWQNLYQAINSGIN